MADRTSPPSARVAITRGPAGYPNQAPFDPDQRYPEYSDRLAVGAESNPAYDTVRRALMLLGLDASRYGTAEWNPLGDIIRPGQNVVIKPNFVLSAHYRGGDLHSIVTHAAVIRVVADYALKAIGDGGCLTIADTPQIDCDFNELLAANKLPVVTEMYRERLGRQVEIRDLRKVCFRYEGEDYYASQENRRALPGDPEGSTLLNLAQRSAFAAVGPRRYYGADYDRNETMRHHSEGRHDYLVSNTILAADVVISIPKLKVHKKVGATLNAKGLVGIVTNKNYLIHYALGGSGSGGDQYPSALMSPFEKSLMHVQRFLFDHLLANRSALGYKLFMALYSPFRRFLRPRIAQATRKINTFDGGNWHGNDSAWRMVSDLMKISLFGSQDGTLKSEPQRRFFSVVDGIVGGDGDGPLFPDARREGVVICGENHLAVDMAAVRLMGFDWRRLAWVADLLESADFDFGVRNEESIEVVSDVPGWTALFSSAHDRFLNFRPHPGWVGHVEIDAGQDRNRG